ncbi:MAG: dihydroorotate dehydrogenase electron transfer subunit [Candidatus Omnitrophica bacterium]|nr:dihydroorotate dehydrogenase electron transfer subunit [Candidatus Omnitrophota bacterium]
MKYEQLKVKEIKKVKSDVFLLSFTSLYLAKKSLPGNFINIKIPPTILRRPFSIHKIDKNTIYVLFRVRGKGTKILSEYKKGSPLDVIGPLGNGFAVGNAKKNILIAGGIGVAPLVFLAKRLRQNHKAHVEVILGAKTKKELLCSWELKQIGCSVLVATDDGSQGVKGTVVNLLNDRIKGQVKTCPYEQFNSNIYVCGPEVMFRGVSKALKGYPNIKCQVSFEQFMGCGLGTCCGCTIDTKSGYKKVCKDGPVFNIRDIYEVKR